MGTLFLYIIEKFCKYLRGSLILYIIEKFCKYLKLYFVEWIKDCKICHFVTSHFFNRKSGSLYILEKFCKYLRGSLFLYIIEKFCKYLKLNFIEWIKDCKICHFVTSHFFNRKFGSLCILTISGFSSKTKLQENIVQ